ncbi:MAG: hypothetical protein ABIJ26_03310 [Candidatus Margulisiibacteriota bacterium]|nr:hypothetical protein [Candidatus Margulisiibacteriota bacterium]
MLKSVESRNEMVLACLHLSTDPVFLRLDQGERMRLISEAGEQGRQIADWIVAEYNSTDPRKIAEQMGVKVHGEEGGGKKKSEYRKKSGEIIVFRDALGRLSNEITVPHLAERLLRFLVANELFHHIEEIKVGRIFKKFPIPVKMGPLTVKKYIPALSDVAAQSFTRSLLKLEFSPRVFAYITYMLFTSDFKR